MRHIKKLYYSFACLWCMAISITSSFAQMGNNWVLGVKGGINFSTSPPKTFEPSIDYSYLYSQAFSDCNGQLLFYTYIDRMVWNKEHKPIPSYNKLDSGSNKFNTFFVPDPGDDSLVYMFTTSPLRFSVLDVRLDSGRGDVKQSPKTIIDSSGQVGGFIKHANDTDYWILVKTNYFNIRAYLLTKNGIAANAVISPFVGIYNVGSQGSPLNSPYLRISNDGNMVISSFAGNKKWNCYIYSFDKSTGKFSQNRILEKYDPNDYTGYHYSFSPNDSIIYALKRIYGNYPKNKSYKVDTAVLYQIDAYHPKPYQTLTEIYRYPIRENIFEGQLGPDNRLYMSCRYDTLSGNAYKMSYVPYPDKWGKACGFVMNGFEFPSNVRLDFLQQFPCYAYPIKRINNHFVISGADGCGYDTVRFTADADSAFKSYHWYFGDGDSAVGKSVVHQYKNAGSYYVKLGCELGNCGYMQWVGDSVTIQFKPNVSIEDSTYYTCGNYHVQTKISYRYCDTLNLHLGNLDTVLYTTNTDTVRTVIYNTLLDTNGTYIYYAAAKNANCHDSVATKHTVLFEPSITASFTPDYITSCGYSTITLTDSSGGKDSIIAQRKWTIEVQNNIVKQYDTASSNKLKLIVQDTGYYNAKLVYVTKQGCMDSLYQTKVFRILPQPDVYIDSNLKNPLCFGDSFILSAKQKNTGYPPLTSYKWNMGQVTTPSIKVDSSNTYYVAAYNNYGCGAQSNKVKIDFLPQLFASVKKAKDSLYVITNRPVVAWEWYKDTILYNTSSSLFHPPTGRYTVTVSDVNGCQASSASLLHTGIPALEPADMLSVVEAYPNPSNGCVTLNAASRSFTYKIYNTAGQLVLFGNGSNGSQTIDLGGSPAGLYYIQILSTDMNVAKRLLLQKD